MNINPIFADKNVRPADYDFLNSDELLITKIFPAVQGEGPFAGRRCVFVRLAGCNLGGKGIHGPGCDFCDTNFLFDQGKRMSFLRIFEKVSSLYPGKIHMLPKEKKLIIITGGEPMLQGNLPAFLRQGIATGFHFQIESNGTRLLDIPPNNTYLVVSPKIPLTPDQKNVTYAEIPARIQERADCLKFIVSADEHNPYHNIPGYALKYAALRQRPVYVSPMAVYKDKPRCEPSSIWDPVVYNHEACARNHAYAAELAMSHGFRLSMQMHLFCNVE